MLFHRVQTSNISSINNQKVILTAGKPSNHMFSLDFMFTEAVVLVLVEVIVVIVILQRD